MKTRKRLLLFSSAAAATAFGVWLAQPAPAPSVLLRPVLEESVGGYAPESRILEEFTARDEKAPAREAVSFNTPSAAPEVREAPRVEAPVVAPVALADIASDLDLSPVQVVALEQLRHEFIEKIGGTNQNPADPSYYARWQAAADETNARFRQLFGDELYMQQEMAARSLR